MNRSQMKADVCYHVAGTSTYFQSPDGVGAYWYDNFEEYFEAHGRPDKIITVQSLTDW